MAYQSQPLDGVFQALADPTRRAVIARLGAGPASVGELARPFDMALPSFMKHLRVLEAGGMIRTCKTGRVRICALDQAPLALAQSWLDAQRALWEGRTDRLERFVMDTQAATEARPQAQAAAGEPAGDTSGRGPRGPRGGRTTR